MASKIIKNMEVRNLIELTLIQKRLDFLSEFYAERLPIIDKEVAHKEISYRAMVTSLLEEVDSLNIKLKTIFENENISL